MLTVAAGTPVMVGGRLVVPGLVTPENQSHQLKPASSSALDEPVTNMKSRQKRMKGRVFIVAPPADHYFMSLREAFHIFAKSYQSNAPCSQNYMNIYINKLAWLDRKIKKGNDVNLSLYIDQGRISMRLPFPLLSPSYSFSAFSTV